VDWDGLASGYQVIVLEGCDGTGKTTLAADLRQQHGYDVVHSGRIPDSATEPGLADQYRSVLDRPGKIAFDRSFISELVYGPLRDGRSRLTAHQVAELTFLLADRGGLLVHLTAHPKTLAARLKARDGYAPAPDRITTLLKSYRDVFTGLAGAAPIATLDTTASPGRLVIPTTQVATVRETRGSRIVLGGPLDTHAGERCPNGFAPTVPPSTPRPSPSTAGTADQETTS
jgi:thymidylate kinase